MVSVIFLLLFTVSLLYDWIVVVCGCCLACVPWLFWLMVNRVSCSCL